MIDDDKKDEGDPDIIKEDDLQGVTGGLRRKGFVANFYGDQKTLDGVNNDTLFAGAGDDSFNIGMPPMKK